MGHSIVYCDKCGLLLKEDDFRQGKAFVADNRNFCSACRPAGSTTPLPQPPYSKISSTRIPKQPSNESISSSRIPKQPQHESRRIPVQAPVAPPPPAAPASNSKMIVLGVGGAVVGLVVIFAMFSGDKKEPRRTEDPTPPVQAVVKVPPPKVENLSPEDRRREEAARTACVKAYEIQTTRPKDLAAQWRAFEAAAAAAAGTSYAGDAGTQLGKIRRRFEEDRAAAEARAQEALSKEQFKAALDLWEEELKRYDVAEWTRPVNDRLAELKADFERRLGVMREAAVDARKRGDDAESKRVRARVAGWGMV